MDALDAILGRRSIRQYTPDAVSDESLTTLLKAAMSAPSANNKQPWHYVVIKTRSILDRMADMHRHGKMLAQAQTAIIVCGDLKLAGYQGHMVLDCAAATENILIAAHALGLGAVWVGLYPWEDRMALFKGLLAIPENIDPIALISLGYPAEQKPPSDRFQPDRVHKERW